MAIVVKHMGNNLSGQVAGVEAKVETKINELMLMMQRLEANFQAPAAVGGASSSNASESHRGRSPRGSGRFSLTRPQA